MLRLKKIINFKENNFCQDWNLERLNECLIGNKKITLNEGVQNTYTKEKKKK